MPAGTQTVPPGMRDVHVPPGTSDYIRGLWERRNYITHVATNDLRARQMNSVLGNLWHLLNPLLQIGVYYVIFGLLLESDRGVDNFVPFLAVGIFVFGFTQRSTMSGANSIVNNRGLLASLSFPRALLPLTSTITETIVAATHIIVIYAVAVLTGETPSLRWLLLVPVFASLVFLNLGAALCAARATNALRDVTQILPFAFRLLFYASGVLFDPTKYPKGQDKQWLFDANPMYCIVSIGRWTIFGGEFRPILLVSFAAWSLAVLTIGLVWFRSAEDSYGR